MKFEWDEAKNRINSAKPGVSFELACKVFDDPLATYLFDRFVDGEERWHVIGQIASLPVLLIVHTYKVDCTGEEVIRIISARQASSHERRHYEFG